MKKYLYPAFVLIVFSLFAVILVCHEYDVPISTEEAATLVWDTIETSHSDLFVPVDIFYTDNLIIVYVECKGLASFLKTAYEAGYDENYPPWVAYKNDFLSTYIDIDDMLIEHGRNDIYLEIWLCNDDKRAGVNSPFLDNLASVTDRDWVDDNALYRYEDPIMD